MALLSTPILTTTEPVPEQFFVPEPEPIIEEVKEEPIEISAKALCNCYKFVQESTGAKLPRMADIAPNVTNPVVGDVVIMKYDTVKHLAVVISVTDTDYTVRESNYLSCRESERTLSYDYRRLVGFYRP